MGADRPDSARLASVVVSCLEPLEFTRACIVALLRHTRGPWELVAVDDGSPDGTAEYLAGVADDAAVPATILPHAEGRGFAAAINRGLEAAAATTSSSTTTPS